MKKLLVTFLALLLLCSCSDNSGTLPSVDVDALVQNVLSSQNLSDEMMVINSSDDEYSDLINQIIGSDYSYAALCFPYVGISSDMVIIVETADETDASGFVTLLQNYLDERYEAYMGYAPEEAAKIKNGLVDSKGKYAFLIVLPDMDSASDALYASF